MGLQFVLGRAGSGKTSSCLNTVREKLKQQPLGSPLIMLVPEQATFQNEYALLNEGDLGGMIRAQVLSFRRLAYRIMQETGGSARIPVGENGKNMLLYKVVRRLSNDLQLYKEGAEQSGFIGKLGELLTEWTRYGIDAPALQEAMTADSGQSLLSRKLHDLQLISQELELEFSADYMDADEDLVYLAEGFGQSEAMRGAEFWVDGFNGFTPRELTALGSLMQHAASVTITLCLDRPYDIGEEPHELDLFYPAAETYGQLRTLAEELAITVHAPILLDNAPMLRFKESAVLAHLEQHFGGRTPLLRRPESDGNVASGRRSTDASLPSGRTWGEDAGIVLNPAVSRRAEVEAAARDMLRMAREKGLRWRDMTVMIRNAEDYADTIRNVFTDYEIPFFLDSKSETLHHPLVELIRSALEIAVDGWRYETVFRCIKTELLFPLEAAEQACRERFDRLENYVLAAGIDHRYWLDAKHWKPTVRDNLEGEPGEVSSREAQRFTEVLESREIIVTPLRKLEAALKKSRKQEPTVEEMCRALYRFLDETGVANRMERWSRADMEAGRTQRARLHRQLWDAVMGLLDQLVELMGAQQVPAELFAGMLNAGLDSLKLGSVPPSLDQVLIGSMDRTRSGSVEVCYVLGCNDGVMPRRMQEDGLLTEAERAVLAERGLQMAPSARRMLLNERFLIYNTLLTPSARLWISYPLADDEGKTIYPSEYIRHLKMLFPWLPEHMASAEPQESLGWEEQLSYLAVPDRSLSYLLSQLRSWRQGARIEPLWWDVYNWFANRPEWHDKMQKLISSLDYVNQVPMLERQTARSLYGERLSASVSRMERFVSCAFQHFSSHGLRLKERKLFRFEAPDMGQLFHAALSRVALELGDEWGNLPHEQVRAAAAEAVAELSPRLQSQILLSSGRYRYITRKLSDIVGRAAIMLGEHAKRAQFRPVGLEVGFGPQGPLPALEIELPQGGSMEIIGRIDRVDAAQTDKGLLIRVLDYKSSATSLRLEEVSHGLSLQMLAYLDVLLTHAPAWLGQEAQPAGVLYFHMHNPLLSVTNALTDEEADVLIRKKFKMRGLLIDDENTIRMMDSGLQSGHSELLPVAIKKDGTFQSGSSIASTQQWDVLRRSVRRTIGKIGQSIGEGNIAIAPYRLGNKTPCQFCDYKSVCQFDPLSEGDEYVKLAKSGKDDTWRKLEQLAEETVHRSGSEDTAVIAQTKGGIAIESDNS